MTKVESQKPEFLLLDFSKHLTSNGDKYSFNLQKFDLLFHFNIYFQSLAFVVSMYYVTNKYVQRNQRMHIYPTALAEVRSISQLRTLLGSYLMFIMRWLPEGGK